MKTCMELEKCTRQAAPAARHSRRGMRLNTALSNSPTEHTAPKRDLVDEPLAIVDGHLLLPDRPGLGIDLNLEAFKHYPPQRYTRPVLTTSDGALFAVGQLSSSLSAPGRPGRQASLYLCQESDAGDLIARSGYHGLNETINLCSKDGGYDNLGIWGRD